jgi:hypothetical protein
LNLRTTDTARTGHTVHPSFAATALPRHRCSCGGNTGFGSSCASCQARELAGPQQSLAQAGSSLATSRLRTPDQDFASHSAAERAVTPESSSLVPSRSAGKLSMRISPGATAAGNRTAVGPGDEESEQTTMSGSTSGNRIDFTFDPTTSSPRPQCDQISIVQWIQMTADGSAILPGTYHTPWVCRDAIALTDATYIDSSPGCPCNSPYYTDCANGTAGSSDGVVRNATSMDGPATGGGTRGFNSAANPTGWNTVSYLFETYAFCAAGTECGTWYDGVRWNYTKTAADAAAGRNGTSTATNSVTAPGPGSTTIRAFNHFNSTRGFSPCKYSVRP